jgi:hypothetical protein
MSIRVMRVTTQPNTPETAIAAVLREDARALEAMDTFAWPDVLVAADRHGVTPLLARRVNGQKGLPTSTTQTLEARLRSAAALAGRQRQEATRVLDALGLAHIDALVIHGEAHAHLLYPASLRARQNTDLIIRETDTRRAEDAMRDLGYHVVSPDAPAGARRQFERHDSGTTYRFEIDDAIGRRPVFAAMASFDDLVNGARPVPALGEHARTPSLVWSLFLACIRCVTPVEIGNRLVWSWDVRLLAERLSEGEWARFWTMAADRQAVNVCERGLSVATEVAGLDAALWQPAQPAAPALRNEPSAAYLAAGLTSAQMAALDARNVRARNSKTGLLPNLATTYVGRAATGLWRSVRSASKA